MDKYKVKLFKRAAKDIAEIYDYICKEFKAPETAENLAEEMEEAILSLEEMPYRGAERKVGRYAGKGYRQLFIKNFTVVYKIDEVKKFRKRTMSPLGTLGNTLRWKKEYF